MHQALFVLGSESAAKDRTKPLPRRVHNLFPERGNRQEKGMDGTCRVLLRAKRKQDGRVYSSEGREKAAPGRDS